MEAFNQVIGLKKDEETQKRIQKYWKKVHRYRWLFSLCPYIELTCICNSLALKNLKEGSDIDLFIITKKDKLFTARLAITLFTSLLGVRRHGKKISKRFCLSFFISEEAMNFEPILIKPQDIYMAFWARSLQPITGDYKSYLRFKKANQSWLNDYFEELPENKSHFKAPGPLSKRIKKILETLLSPHFIEAKLQKWQLSRAQAKAKNLTENSGTILTKNMLKFHDKDQRPKLQKEWEERI